MAVETEVEVKVLCDECDREAASANCVRHENDAAEYSFEEGKKVGYDEGYAAAREEFEKVE